MDYEIDVIDAGGKRIHKILNVDGIIINTFRDPQDVAVRRVKNIKNVKIRDDDILLWTAPKSGTHWMFEILSMLLSNKAEMSEIHKVFLMLCAASEERLDSFSSPRIINSHLPFERLPIQMHEKKTKAVLVLRNPKDVAVSFYYHYKGLNLHEYDGKWEDFLPLFLEGKTEYGSWFDFVLGTEKAMESEPERFHLIYFEDLVENGLQEIQKVAIFLQVEGADNIDLCQAIHDKCSFKSFKAAKTTNSETQKIVFKGGFNMIRKGIIGDWKNHFTVAQSETFDKLYAEKMKGSKLKFRFEPSRKQDQCNGVNESL